MLRGYINLLIYESCLLDIPLKVLYCCRQLVEDTMKGHKNAKEAKKKLQEYKQKIGESRDQAGTCFCCFYAPEGRHNYSNRLVCQSVRPFFVRRITLKLCKAST